MDASAIARHTFSREGHYIFCNKPLLVERLQCRQNLAQGGVVNEVPVLVEDLCAFRVPARKEEPRKLGPLLAPSSVKRRRGNTVLLQLARRLENIVPRLRDLEPCLGQVLLIVDEGVEPR